MKPLYKGRRSILQVGKTAGSSVFEFHPVVVKVIIAVVFTDVQIKIHLIHAKRTQMFSVKHAAFPHGTALKELNETPIGHAKLGEFPWIELTATQILCLDEFTALDFKVHKGSIDVIKDSF